MREYMKEHIELVDKYLKEDKHNKINDFLDNHLKKISFFQHERFIHLCVTLCYAFFTIIFFALTLVSFIFIPIALIVITFLVLYIYHYFYLENGVQYMYKQYDKLKALEK